MTPSIEKHKTADGQLTRRQLLKNSGRTLIAMTVMPTGLVIGANDAWSAAPSAMTPETFATLVQACRDIYPHDQLSDAIYAKVVEGFDASITEDTAEKALIEEGVAKLDQASKDAHGVDYTAVAWERDRTDILRGMEADPFFQKLRGSLVTGIYNNQDVWPIFGYEGESASKGGYINRGFDDIDWLDQA